MFNCNKALSWLMEVFTHKYTIPIYLINRDKTKLSQIWDAIL